MATTKKKPIHVNVDENLKEAAEQLFDDLGLNMTSAITIFLKQSINEQAIPFMINKGNKDTLQALKDIEVGNVHGGFSSVEDLMEDINAWNVLHEQFKKDFKKAKKQGKNLEKLKEVLVLLQEQQILPPKYKDHALTGNYIGTRECHIEPDWLLIYKIDGDKLILTLARIGSHSELLRWIGKILQINQKTLLNDQTNSSVFWLCDYTK